MKAFAICPAIAGAVALVLALPAIAQQDDVLFDLMRCDRFADQAERMACFNGMVEAYKRQIGSEANSGAPAPTAVPTPQGWQSVNPTPPNAAETAATEGTAASVAEEDLRDLDDKALRERVETFYAATRAPQVPPRAPSVDDLPLPFETTVTAFVINSAGDFKLRIKEGWVFKDSGGPPLNSATLKDKKVILQKNMFGMWRMKVDDEPGLVALTPVSR